MRRNTVAQCSNRLDHSGRPGGDHQAMKTLDTLSHNLLALAVSALPATALVLDQLDKSMRRPTLAGVVLHSLKLAF